jgi:putative transposase
MPKRLHTKARRALQEIRMAGTKRIPLRHWKPLSKTYKVKSQRAADCLIKDRDALLAYYNLPRALEALTNDEPLESNFAIVRHRTIRSKGRLSNKTALAMVSS